MTMTINRDYYLEQARALRKLADEISNATDKRELIKLAEKWEALAAPPEPETES